MRKFLTQFMSAEELDKLEAAYKAKNEGAAGLPTYIPKTRFDEIDTKRKAAEQLVAGFEVEKTKAVKEATDAIEEKYKNQKAEFETKLQEANKTTEITAKIYESGARNVRAVRALLDTSKPIEEQLTALKTSDSYLFGGNMPKGTGKNDETDKGSEKEKLTEAAMYKAVGIIPPQN